MSLVTLSLLLPMFTVCIAQAYCDHGGVVCHLSLLVFFYKCLQFVLHMPIVIMEE